MHFYNILSKRILLLVIRVLPASSESLQLGGVYRQSLDLLLSRLYLITKVQDYLMYTQEKLLLY